MFPSPNIGPVWLHETIAGGETGTGALAVFLDSEEVPDSLYGQLRLNDVEVHIINTPEFQRLRYISQLAFAKAAFHTAEHSRFSHSVGACHVAKMLVDRLNANLAKAYRDFSPEDREKYWDVIEQRGGRTTSGDCSRAYRAGEIVTWTERVLIGLAGLLHDLPHGPYSHDLEGGLPAVIPKHDDYRRNPAFAIMLFDTRRSSLARVLEFYSEHFYQLMLHDLQWQNCQRLRIYENPLRRKRMLADSIFELLAFEKTVDIESGFVEVSKLEWPSPHEMEPETILWRVAESDAWSPDAVAEQAPFRGNDWFQPYRHDLIGNTICADLVDYLARDAVNAAVPISLDFKFLSRLFLNLYDEDDEGQIALHVVFDLRDMKRGTIRYDVLHELFDYLRERFKIRERVTSHRVTHEGAAILKRALTLLTFRPDMTRYEKPFITLERLHMDYRCNSDDSLLRYLCTSGGVLEATLDSDGLDVTPPSRPPDFDANGPPLDVRLRAAGLAKRLIERRFHRPLALLTSRSGFERIEKFAKSFEAPNDKDKGSLTESDVVRNVWAIENRMLGHLGSAIDGIPDKAIAYALQPRQGFKDAEMVVVTYDDQRSPVTLRLMNATGEKDREKKLEGVKETIDASMADYLSLWRVFLLVAPDLLSNQEDAQKTALGFHAWVRGWREVRILNRKGMLKPIEPEEMAKRLSEPDHTQWLNNVKDLATGQASNFDEASGEIVNGVDFSQITYSEDEAHRCRDIRRAFRPDPSQAKHDFETIQMNRAHAERDIVSLLTSSESMSNEGAIENLTQAIQKARGSDDFRGLLRTLLRARGQRRAAMGLASEAFEDFDEAFKLFEAPTEMRQISETVALRNEWAWKSREITIKAAEKRKTPVINAQDRKTLMALWPDEQDAILAVRAESLRAPGVNRKTDDWKRWIDEGLAGIRLKRNAIG